MAATSEIDECFSRHERFKYEIWMTCHIYPGFVRAWNWLFSTGSITFDYLVHLQLQLINSNVVCIVLPQAIIIISIYKKIPVMSMMAGLL